MKLEVVGKLGGSLDVPRCDIGSGGEIEFVIGCAHV